jgi:hypothetical protein
VQGHHKEKYPELKNNMLLPESEIQELRLKLTGAFERLEALPDEMNKTETLIGVFQNFFGDIT